MVRDSMGETGHAGTSETLLQDSSELLDEFMARCWQCWQDGGSECKQVAWSMHPNGHLSRRGA
eukprot:5861962-Alexandrium_andersonii.AAC.1